MGIREQLLLIAHDGVLLEDEDAFVLAPSLLSLHFLD
jgi:hypothetical protein